MSVILHAGNTDQRLRSSFFDLCSPFGLHLAQTYHGQGRSGDILRIFFRSSSFRVSPKVHAQSVRSPNPLCTSVLQPFPSGFVVHCITYHYKLPSDFALVVVSLLWSLFLFLSPLTELDKSTESNRLSNGIMKKYLDRKNETKCTLG